MRVLYFTRDFTPHDHRFLTALAGQGDEVFSLRLERSAHALEDRSLPPTVTQVHWRGGQRPFRWADLPMLLIDLRRVLAELHPDVIHAGPIQTVAFLAALAGAHPLVSMSWGSDLLRDADQSAMYGCLTRFALRHSDALVGDCAAVRNKAMTFGFPAERAFLFPWGVDLAHFCPAVEDSALRERLGWQDCFVVLSNRSWEPVYGVDVALRGFAQAAQAEPRLRLLLLGSGSLAGMVHKTIQHYGLEQQVFLGGRVSQTDLPRYYQAADLYLSASHSDGSSVSLMEALGCGTPALVSDIPGNREWIEQPGQVGWMFADNDVTGCAEGILRVVDMGESLRLMRGRARQLAEQRADWTKNFRVLGKAYQAAIALRKGS